MTKLLFFWVIGIVFLKADGDEDIYVPSLLTDLIKKENPVFAETFDNADQFKKKWVTSSSVKDDADDSIAKYDGDWVLESAQKHGIERDLGLTFKTRAKHRAITAKLNRKYTFTTSPLVVQYEVTFQDGQECGGGYLKLYSQDKNGIELQKINDKSPYTIMFGPDKCGNSNKVHFIFRHKNPLNGEFEEKHCKPPTTRFDHVFTDGNPHLFTLILYPTNRYKILIDQEIALDGSFFEDFTPPINPPAEIDDPTDEKPKSWDDREKIPDPNAVKPPTWDESAPKTIPDPAAVKPDNWLDNEPLDIVDPSAEKPDDWDEEMDGEWEAPLVPNPACEDAAGCGPWSPPEIANPDYKGKWSAPLIDNPSYQGKWVPKKIPNPGYFEDKEPFQMTPIVAVGFELWSMSANILFDNILVCDNEIFANTFAQMTYNAKMKRINKSSETLWTRLMKRMNYKPGWWALYFVYCCIPIGGYAWYLWWRVREVTVLSEIVDFTNKYPWLWAAYTLILLIPVTLFVYFCFWTRKDSAQDIPCEKHEESQDEKPLLEEKVVDKQIEEIPNQIEFQDDDAASEHNSYNTDASRESSVEPEYVEASMEDYSNDEEGVEEVSSTSGKNHSKGTGTVGESSGGVVKRRSTARKD